MATPTGDHISEGWQLLLLYGHDAAAEFQRPTPHNTYYITRNEYGQGRAADKHHGQWHDRNSHCPWTQLRQLHP
jgi:hypothetical protein